MDMPQTAVERELPLPLAQQRIDEQLRLLSLSVEEHWQGSTIGSARVALTAPCGTLSRGCGKGREIEARIGARFEALEHFLDLHYPRTASLRQASELAAACALRDDMLQPWLAEQPERTLACQAYHSLRGDWLFDYPLALSRPDHADQPFPKETFDYRGLRRYSSNDGSAIGATFYEAVLHALNQRVERDALSLFFLRHYYHQIDAMPRWVHPPEARTELGDLWREAEQCLDAPIRVLDISTEFASRTYLALRCASNTTMHGPWFGAGSSLDPWHAVRRALTELVQVQLNTQLPGALDEANLAQRLLRPYPRLSACQQFDLAPLLRKTGQQAALPPPVSQASVEAQVMRLSEDLEYHGRRAGICEVFGGHRGISLVNVVIPGLEHFHLVCSGNIVCPGPRGLLMKGGES